MVTPLPPLVDSHCHLAFSAFSEDRAEVLKRAREAGLVACIAVSVGPQSAQEALQLAEAEPGFVFPTAGVHPTEDEIADPGAFEAVAECIRSGAFVAVGETGLDAHHQRTDMNDQLRSLDQHLKLALDTDLPVILHCREAFPQLREALLPFSGAPLRGVLHCFTGDAADIQPLLESGLHLGAGGITTFKPREDLRAAFREVPDERVLIETDAPWLAPVPRRGRRNEPAFVAHIAERLALDRGQDYADFAELTTRNAKSLFRLP
ncbi:MAG: TatD DNase family protein [Pseudohongiellaceae bacterium]